MEDKDLYPPTYGGGQGDSSPSIGKSERDILELRDYQSKHQGGGGGRETNGRRGRPFYSQYRVSGGPFDDGLPTSSTPSESGYSQTSAGVLKLRSFLRKELPLLCIIIFSMVLILIYLKSVLMPFTVALFLFYLLNPIVDSIENADCQSCCGDDDVENPQGHETSSCVNTICCGCCSRGNDDDDEMHNNHGHIEGLSNEDPLLGNSKKKRPTTNTSGERVSNKSGETSTSRTKYSLRKDSTSAEEVQKFLNSDAYYHRKHRKSEYMGSGNNDDRNAIVSFCQRSSRQIKRAFGIAFALALAFASLGMVVLIIMQSIDQVRKDNFTEDYVNQGKQMELEVLAWLNKTFHVDGRDALDKLVDGVNFGKIISDFIAYFGNLAEFASWIILFLFFLLLYPTGNQGNLRYTVDGFPLRSMPSSSSVLQEKVKRSISEYITIKAAVSLVMALFVLIIYIICSVPLAGLFTFLTFVLNFIPSIGALLATVLPFPFIVFSPLMSQAAKWCAVLLPLLVHLMIPSFLEPVMFERYMGTTGDSPVRLRLHPVIILLALGVWYTLWGVVGAILAVPITAILQLVLSEAKEHCQNHRPPINPRLYRDIVFLANIFEGRISFEDERERDSDEQYDNEHTGNHHAEDSIDPLPVGRVRIESNGLIHREGITRHDLENKHNDVEEEGSSDEDDIVMETNALLQKKRTNRKKRQ
eukprot:g2398.t1